MFHDFDKTKYTLHNQYFWKNVQRQWKNKDILKKAFNYTGSEEEFKRMLFGNENEEGDGLHLLYYGYSWYKSISWNATLYEAIYKNGAANKEKNMHLASTKEQTRHMKEIDIDCRKMGKDNFFDYNTFFNDGGIYRWTVRHATGKELASDGRYDVRTAIRGVTEVYRYYHDVEPTAADAYATTDPEETPKPKTINKDDVKVGHIIAQSGSFYANCEDARDSQDEPVAMVVYLGSKNRVEKDQPWNGLAIALKDLRMGDGKYPRYVSFCEDASQKREKCNSGTSDNKALASFCNGWAVTQKLKDHCNAGHKHPVAEAVWNMDKVDGCSEWFIPAAGQWDLAMLGQGFGRYSAGGNWGLWGYHNEQGKWLFKQAGAEDSDIELEGYITCTETENGYKLWYFQGHLNMDGFDFFTRDKTEFFFLRPFIAFEYGNGGSVNPEEPWAPLPVQEVQAKSWLGEDGNFYKTVDHVRTATAKDPVAYVVYVGEEGSIEVDNKKYRGLAISVKEEDADIIGLTWNQLNDKAKQYTTNLTEKVRQEKGFSPWFAASKDYWQKAFEQGFGLQFEIIDGQLVSKERFTAVAWTYLNVANYWTATEDGDKAYYFSLSRDPNDNSLRDKVRFLLLDKTATAVNKEADKMAFRPMIAFR
jgi:hypothetical protein